MSLRTSISYILFPFTIWYAVGVAVRNFFFSIGLKKQVAPHITTIGVGNLSTGGTGKTPHVEYLLGLLSDKYPTAMLSRGYKRKSKGFQADDGSHDALQLGDEPAMVASKFPKVKVAVCEKRIDGIRRLMDDNTGTKPHVVVLDDAFQHRSIKPSVNILLTEFGNPFFNDHILPYGNLREFKSARYRASIVIVTKCPEVLNPIDRHNITNDLRLLNYQKVFFSYYKYAPLQDLDGHPVHINLDNAEHLLVVTGIASPEPLLTRLGQKSTVHHMAYADHHAYTKRDIKRIREAYEALPGDKKYIITTEKDAVRIAPLADGLPIYVQPIQVAFHKNSDTSFDQTIENAVSENISFLSKLSIWS